LLVVGNDLRAEDVPWVVGEEEVLRVAPEHAGGVVLEFGLRALRSHPSRWQRPDIPRGSDNLCRRPRRQNP